MNLIERDHKHIWHPCSPIHHDTVLKPLVIARAEGCYLELADGRKLIDAISSWWCKSLGHGHPRLKKALMQQLEKFEHVIFANTTHDVIVELSEKLAQLTSTLDKVFYASDGSCAVEIAMKMSIHARKIQGEDERMNFIALKNSYHGETVGAMSVSDVGLYRKPYENMLFNTFFIEPPPVTGRDDPLWDNCEAHWPSIEKQLEAFAETATAMIVEPIVQGAGGMIIYSQDFLRRCRAWTKKHNVHLIADEIMTGLGRTGKMLACQHADIEPDFLCLSKGLTSGWLPLSVVLTRASIYELFCDIELENSFLHSHTHSGNALAARVALETLKVMEEEHLSDKANEIGRMMTDFMLDIAMTTQKLTRVRGIGAIVAADWIGDDLSQFSTEFSQRAAASGALLRPLGRTLYWLPPLTIAHVTLYELKRITEKVVREVLSPFAL